MELFFIIYVPISVENNCDDNQILISSYNHFYSHFLGGHYSFNTLYVKKVSIIFWQINLKPIKNVNLRNILVAYLLRLIRLLDFCASVIYIIISQLCLSGCLSVRLYERCLFVCPSVRTPSLCLFYKERVQ